MSEAIEMENTSVDMLEVSTSLAVANWLVSTRELYHSDTFINPSSFGAPLRSAQRATDSGQVIACLIWLEKWQKGFASTRSRAIVLAIDKPRAKARWKKARELVQDVERVMKELDPRRI